MANSALDHDGSLGRIYDELRGRDGPRPVSIPSSQERIFDTDASPASVHATRLSDDVPVRFTVQRLLLLLML